MAPMTEPLTIGWVGTGVMGGPMAGHLLESGHHARGGRSALARRR